MIRKLISLIFLVTLTNCQNIEWDSSPPKEFQGKFIQVSDAIIQGYQQPIILEITEREIYLNYIEIESSFRYPILKISKTKNHIIIFCGEKNENHIAEHRYQLTWRDDNYLYITEIVATGINDDDGEFEVGKFTMNR